MATYLKLKAGSIQYKVVGIDEGTVTAIDPHTKERFKIPAASGVLKVCGYKVIRKTGEKK